jgi:hypothetical protein
MEMEAELFDRYVREVGRHLPKNQRADVEAELHSLLMDALQDRTAGQDVDEGGTVPEADQVAVLQAFGPPARVAAEYTPPRRYLIGPRLYDLYLIVAAAVLGSLTLVHLLLLGLVVWGEPAPWSALASSLGGVLENYVSAVLAGLGSVTLTFAILERVLPESMTPDLGEEEWDPRTLPEIQDRTRIEVGGLVVESVLLVLALVVFNFFPQWVGVGFVGSIDGAPIGWHMRPLLSPGFFTAYMPLLNVLWIATLVFNLVLLRQGRWQRLTRVMDLVLTVGAAFVLYRMAFGPPILTMDAIQSASLRDLLDSVLTGLLKVALIIGLIATIGQAVHKLYLIFRAERLPAYAVLDAHEPAKR